jgi:predicted ATPase
MAQRINFEGLSQIRFHHFKAFKHEKSADGEEPVQINLERINIIAGVNSSGKSTILQGFLLAQNSLSTKEISLRESALIYGTPPLKFVDFRELVFGMPKKEAPSMRLGFSVSNKIEKDFQEAGIDLRKNSFVNIGLDADFSFDKQNKNVVVTSISLNADSGKTPTAEKLCSMTFKPISGTEPEQWHIEYFSGDLNKQTDEYLTLDRFIPLWDLRGRPSSDSSDDRQDRQQLYRIYRDLFSPALQLMRELLTTRLHYVGPLRSAPEPAIRQQQLLSGLDIGASGEKAIQLIYEHIQKQVKFVAVPENLDEFNLAEIVPASVPLKDAITNALRLLGINQRLDIKQKGKSYEAKFSLHGKKGTFVPITDVGFGISQILPIIAICLLSPVGDILLFEQPEIHLHPRAQAGLADLLLCVALSGRQVILETHSDHLINRMRRRMAEDKRPDTESRINVNIIFVSPPDSPSDGAKVDVAKIDSRGNIQNWPVGFLAESAVEAHAILRANANRGK